MANFPSGWAGYEEILIRNFPTTSTTSGQVFRVFTSGFSTEWKNAVTSNGRDIRVTTANGTRLPVDVINTGYFEFNLTGSYPRDTRERIKIWVGNAGADFEPATGEFGQYAVYPSYYYAYYPSGGGLDRTRNQIHLTGVNTQTGDSFIPSLPSTFYDGSAYSISNSSYTGSVPLMMSTYFKSSVMTGDQVLMGTFNGDSTGNFNAIILRGNGDVTVFLTHSTNTRLAVQGDNYTSGVWGQAGGRMNAFNDRAVYTDGLEQASSSTNIIASGINRIGIGACLGSSISGHSQAHISWTKFYTGIKSEAEILYDFQNANNFYISSGWRPAFNPNGWSGYDEISISYEASGDLYDQIYLLSTSLLSPTLKSNANISGADLRIVKTDNVTELPLDVINFNQSNTGMLAFSWPGIKTSGQRDKIRVWAGNPSASKANVTGVFGQYNVYNTGIIGFYPDGGGQDRSRNQYNMTGFNAGTGDTTGPLSGLKATEYGGVNSLSSVRIPQLIRRPLNIWSIFQTDLTQIQVVAAAGAISNSRYNNAIRLNHLGQVTHHTDVNGGTLEVVALSGYSTATWYGADAYNDNASTRMIYLNGQHRNNGSIGLFFGTNVLSIGAFSGTTTPSTGQFFNGRISLTVFDGSTRSGYEPEYNHEMIFNHNNFYGASGWTTFAQSGVTNIYLEGYSNTFTYAQSNIFVTKSLDSISNTKISTVAIITLADGEITFINLDGVSSTSTSMFGTIYKTTNIDGHSNTKTNAIGALVKDIRLFGDSNTSTSALGMVTLTVSLDAISATRTSLTGFATLIDLSNQPDSDFEITVYVTIEKGKGLYICRQKDLDLFIARNNENLSLYIAQGLILP